MRPFEDRPVGHGEEASGGGYEVIGTDVEMECGEMGAGDGGHEVRGLAREELEMCHQYKEFCTILGGGQREGAQFWLYSWTWGQGVLSWSASWPGRNI